MTKAGKNSMFRVKTDGFHGELFLPSQDKYPGKALICFSGSDGRFEWSRMLAAVFQSRGLTALALAYVMEESLPDRFYHVPIDTLEAAAKRLREHGFSHPYQHLSYDCGSHLFIPIELGLAKFFVGDRGKHKEPSRKAKMDSLTKTLEFVSLW